MQNTKPGSEEAVFLSAVTTSLSYFHCFFLPVSCTLKRKKYSSVASPYFSSLSYADSCYHVSQFFCVSFVRNKPKTNSISCLSQMMSGERWSFVGVSQFTGEFWMEAYYKIVWKQSITPQYVYIVFLRSVEET